MIKSKMNIISRLLALAVFVCGLFCGPLCLDAADTASKDTWIPVEYQQYCEEIGARYAISPELLMAIIEKESSGQPQVYNGNCKGLMQINEPYHRGRMQKLGVTNIYDPYGNITLGADYLLELFMEYQETGTVLMVYNGSSRAVERGEAVDYTQYASEIIERAAFLERLHGK